MIDQENEERINYYLGEKFISETNIENIIHDYYASFVKITEINENDMNNNERDNYYKPFHILLTKTNNINKRFKYCFGDIQHKESFVTLVKNRYYCNHSIILRCLNLQRHWKLYYNKPHDIDFSEKINKVFWRGDTSGNKYKKANRFQLIELWADKNENIDVGFSNISEGKEEYSCYLKEMCSPEYFLKNKYILSIEGNDKDSGLNWKLNSNSLVFMAKPNITSWLMETKLIPDYHFILLQDDFSDLEEKLNWCNNNKDKCKDIIKNANLFMNKFADNKVEETIEEGVINEYFKKLEKNV